VAQLVEAFILGNGAILTNLSMSITTFGYPELTMALGAGRVWSRS
jgi:hypothetical protein